MLHVILSVVLSVRMKRASSLSVLNNSQHQQTVSYMYLLASSSVIIGMESSSVDRRIARMPQSSIQNRLIFIWAVARQPWLSHVVILCTVASAAVEQRPL